MSTNEDHVSTVKQMEQDQSVNMDEQSGNIQSTMTPEEIKREGRNDKIVYPLSELSGGIFKAYFITYMSMLLTNVYMLPITLAGVLEALQNVVQWFAAPVMGVVYDRASFKKSKYYPWWYITGVGAGIAYILFFGAPVVVSDPTGLVIFAIVFNVLSAWLTASSSALGVTLFAYFGKTQKSRSYLSMGAKIARDGMKVVVGFIFPVLLAVLLDSGMPEVQAWALVAVILAGAAMVFFIATGVFTKKSSVEREFREGALSGKAKKKGSLLKTIKAILTNRAMLVCFVCMTLSKIFFFFHITGASYFWRYYMGDIGMMAGFNTVFSLAAIVGVLTVPFFLKVFKDNKVSYCVAFGAQIVFYAISLFVVSPDNPIGTIAILAAASFFNGISDGFIIPLFAGAADYSAWKSGNKDYGLNMAVYSISIRAGNVISVAIRTALLAGAAFSIQVITDTGIVSDAVMMVLHDYNTLYPLICCIAITLLMVFLNPLNDKKIEQYRSEIAERDKVNEA